MRLTVFSFHSSIVFASEIQPDVYHFWHFVRDFTALSFSWCFWEVEQIEWNGSDSAVFTTVDDTPLLLPFYVNMQFQVSRFSVIIHSAFIVLMTLLFTYTVILLGDIPRVRYRMHLLA